MWRIIDPPAGSPLQPEIHRLIRVLHDLAYADWLTELQIEEPHDVR